MRELLSVLGATAAAMLFIGIVVFGARDRATLVPPPEAVAESFAREVSARRFDLAMNYLSEGTRQKASPAELAAGFERLLAVAGKVNQVDAEGRWTSADRAAARANIKGDRQTIAFDVSLVRELGLWKIDRLPDLVR